MNKREVIVVKIARGPSGFDFSIKGGAEHGIGLIVSDIKEEGVADGEIEVGDELLRANGTSLVGLKHEDAVDILKNAGKYLELEVRPNPTLKGALGNHRYRMMTSFQKMRSRIRSNPSLSVTKPKISAPPPQPFPEEYHSEMKKRSRSLSEGQSPVSVQSLNSGSKSDGDEESELQPTVLFVEENAKALPEGWESKVDPTSKRIYYENHYTRLSTWTNPNSMPKPKPIKEYDWTDLPPGWESAEDDLGFTYYVNHDSQSTSWYSPRDMRQRYLLPFVLEHIHKELPDLEESEAKLKSKRAELLTKKQELDNLNQRRDDLLRSESHDDDDVDDVEKQMAIVVEDVMKMNEELEKHEIYVINRQKKLTNLQKVAKKSSHELDDVDRGQTNAGDDVASRLSTAYENAEETYQKQLTLVRELELMRKQAQRHNPVPESPLTYLLQVPKQRETDSRAIDTLHLLEDGLTPKTNCEMAIERHFLDSCVDEYEIVCRRLERMIASIETNDRTWDDVIDELTGMEMPNLHEPWQHWKFSEKLSKCSQVDRPQ
ncbi:membrane-associated guanylate kinase, WW and PDZ domain-containing protein 3-like [Oscarella lobularis]|uniref:membrane-associated guanylate kinase, WW and PDZ domain-containing protein 3-like n=1 Tax=Oscarella lobularis TaxID=121494 RepID=UPI00331391DB